VSGDATRVLIVAGEASGDLYGGLLMEAMARTGTGETARFVGVGGPAMRAAGLEALGDAEVLGVTGLLEVLGSFGAIWRAYRAACNVLEQPGARPRLAILIDYPDFNIRLARRARRAGVPVLYFISPQVWAWRKGRVRRIAEAVDRMLVILPFEEEIYRRASVPVEFVGHPLLDLVRPSLGRAQVLAPLGLDAARPTVALLPGSRWNEIRAHLPAMIGAARKLHDEFRDLQFILPVAPTLGRTALERALKDAQARSGAESMGLPGSFGPVLVESERYDAVAACNAAVVASGTASLETALLGVPMVIVYRMNPLTYALARAVSEVPHIGMPNLIAGERVVPELVQGDCTPERIATELRRILTDPMLAGRIRLGLSTVRARLGRPGAIPRAARAAWSMIGGRGGGPSA
jgi:lipid-A-disaccharide synthase